MWEVCADAVPEMVGRKESFAIESIVEVQYKKEFYADDRCL